MSVVEETIRVEQDDAISFGDYSAKEKKKVNDFELNGDLYKVKTHRDVTRLEKNGKLLLECVPGSTIHSLRVSDKLITFSAEGFEDTQITLELSPEEEYEIFVGEAEIGSTKANLAGKISFSAELSAEAVPVKITKA